MPASPRQARAKTGTAIAVCVRGLRIYADQDDSRPYLGILRAMNPRRGDLAWGFRRMTAGVYVAGRAPARIWRSGVGG
jgi:hypothetical protein